MNLLIASNNSQKIKEIKTILKDRFDNIVSLKEAKINCDPEENGQTFYENALIKANEIAKHTSFTVLADDTGLCVNSLNGEPGVYSARYGGDHDSAKIVINYWKNYSKKRPFRIFFKPQSFCVIPTGPRLPPTDAWTGVFWKEKQAATASATIAYSSATS